MSCATNNAMCFLKAPFLRMRVEILLYSPLSIIMESLYNCQISSLRGGVSEGGPWVVKVGYRNLDMLKV